MLLRPIRPLAFALTALVLASPAHAAPMRAPTAEEAAWHAKVDAAIAQAMPKAFRDWQVSRPDGVPDPAQIEFCEGETCPHRTHQSFFWAAKGMEDKASAAARDAADAIREDDVESTRKLNKFLAKLYAKNSIEIDVFVNYSGNLQVPHCADVAVTPLAPPKGWDLWYQGSALECMGEQEMHDQGFVAAGPPPVSVDPGAWCSPSCAATATWAPADAATYPALQVRNVVMRVRASRPVAEEFLKAMDTGALTGLVAK